MFRIDQPQGGWYVPLRIRRSLFGDAVRSSVDAHAVFLYYGEDDPKSGVALLPGELFGQGCEDDWFRLRANLAGDGCRLGETVNRLRDMATALRGDRRQEIVDYALTRSRRVVPHLEAAVINRRY